MGKGCIALPWQHMKYSWCRILGIGIVLTGMIVCSCKKDSREELFDLHFVVDFEVPPGLNTFDTHFFVIGPLTSNYAAKLESSGHSEEEVTAIEPKKAFLTTTFEDIDLNYVHRVSIFIFDPFHPADKIEFLYLDPVPFKNKVVIQLFPGIADISEWIKREYFGVEVRLDFREVTPVLAPMRLEFDLRALGS